MNVFKVNDKVRFIKTHFEIEHKLIGKIGIITDIDDRICFVKFYTRLPRDLRNSDDYNKEDKSYACFSYQLKKVNVNTQKLIKKYKGD